MEIRMLVSMLADYAVKKKLIAERDRIYSLGLISKRIMLEDIEKSFLWDGKKQIGEILAEICLYAADKGIISEGTAYADLFDTAIMGDLTPLPSVVEREFMNLLSRSPKEATDYLYTLSYDSNYIRADRIEKDIKWKTKTKSGELEITINLSKPEKDPKQIATARSAFSGYPACMLCIENEGYPGRMDYPARQNLRTVSISLAGEKWRLQYSPYVYYNEHCIALNESHTPMRIERKTFMKLLDFVSIFPHYFIGCNADLPIVGGSILSHDHFQGGCHTFPMEKAAAAESIRFEGYDDVEGSILDWPASVIRLSSHDKDRLVWLADRILNAWRAYSDPSLNILSHTGEEGHNTITPIARRREGSFELDLVLRNNRTTPEHTGGIFHPHADKHHIKKENIGLIEVMGLAVLPSRLKKELEILSEYILKGESAFSDPMTAKHAHWAERLMRDHKFTVDNIDEILKEEVGKVFAGVLEDTGVYKQTADGRAGFLRFVQSV